MRLCSAARLVRLGVIALDGTKVAANAADKANRTLDKTETEVAEILRQAAEADQREDLEHGHARGDELPVELASPTGRLARLRQAKARLEAEAAERQRRYQQRVAELAAAARAKGRQPRSHIKPRPRDEAPNPKATANVTDPDSRFLRTRGGTVQGYNARPWSPPTRSWWPPRSPSRPTICNSCNPCCRRSARPWPPQRSQTASGRGWPTPATSRSPTSPRSPTRPSW